MVVVVVAEDPISALKGGVWALPALLKPLRPHQVCLRRTFGIVNMGGLLWEEMWCNFLGAIQCFEAEVEWCVVEDFSVHGKGLNHDEVCKQLAALGSQMDFFYHVPICRKCRCLVCHWLSLRRRTLWVSTGLFLQRISEMEKNTTNWLWGCVSTSSARRCFSRKELQSTNLSGTPFMRIDVRKAFRAILRHICMYTYLSI